MDPEQRYDSLATGVRFALTEWSKGINTCLPGIVHAYDAATRRATVQPAIDMLTTDGRTIPRPLVANVPVVAPAGGGWSVSLPLEAGDPVLLVFSQRGLTGFKRAHERAAPDADRLMAMGDAIAIPGFGPISITEVSTDGIVLQSNDGTEYIALEPGGVRIKTSGIVAIESAGLTHNGVNVGDDHVHGLPSRQTQGGDTEGPAMTRTISAGDTDLAEVFGVASDIEAVRQRVRQRLLLYRGESFLDASTGVPYTSDLLGRRLPNVLASAIIADQVRGVTGVDAVTNVDVVFDPRTRKLSIEATVEAVTTVVSRASYSVGMARVTSTGIEPTALAGYVERLQTGFRSALGQDLDVATESPAGQIIGVLGLVFAEQDEAVVAVGNGQSRLSVAGCAAGRPRLVAAYRP